MENSSAQVTFYRSNITEAIHYIILSGNIYRNFYKRNNIYILPRLVKNNYRCIYYPSVRHNISDFWRRSLKRYVDIKDSNDELISSVVDIFSYEEIDYKLLMEEFFRHFEKVWSFLNERMGKLFNTVCMQYSWFLEDSSVIRLFPRFDTPISEVYKMMVYERLCRFNDKYNYTWSERIANSEFLVLEAK